MTKGKKIFMLILAAGIIFSAISIRGCVKVEPLKNQQEAENEAKKKAEEVTANDYVTINGICVDDSYRDADESPLRMVYLFYTLSANDKNLKIDSLYTYLTIDKNNTYLM